MSQRKPDSSHDMENETEWRCGGCGIPYVNEDNAARCCEVGVVPIRESQEDVMAKSADRFETIKARQYRTESYLADDIPWLIAKVEHLRRLVPADGKLTAVEEAQAASIRHWQAEAERLRETVERVKHIALLARTEHADRSLPDHDEQDSALVRIIKEARGVLEDVS